jgi:hypothetical protein
MQLRVARLCLDCEELHVENRCPRCASERYAFLTNWLPSEERRKWPRRSQGQNADSAPRGVRGFIDALARWHRGDRTSEDQAGPQTRASDHVVHLNFDEPAADRREAAAIDTRLSKNDAGNR